MLIQSVRGYASLLLGALSTISCAALYDFGGDDKGGAAPTGSANATSQSTGGGSGVNGDLCTLGGQCQSGHCVDGVCCNTACDQGCSACAVALTGVPSGTCAPVTNGTDPKAACAAEPTNCLSGVCRQGACEAAPDARTCGQSSCVAGIKTAAPLCMSGTCISSEPIPCAGVCDSAGIVCNGECSAASPCPPDSYCDSNNNCAAKKPNGTPCTESGQCVSSQCFVRGGEAICCDEECKDGCKSCLTNDTKGEHGKCLAVKDDSDPADVCPKDDGNPCGGTGNCRSGACALEKMGAECGSAMCEGNMYTRARTCDGQGMCSAQVVDHCGYYRCNEVSCPVICASDSECFDAACLNGMCVPE